MIRIRKPEDPPRVLRERGPAATAAVCARVAAGEQADFDRDLYGCPEVKQALRSAQHDKCCFCEAKLSHTQPGDVEHFRPKARAQQSPSTASTAGYYWLAYAWTNLYLSCALCRARHNVHYAERRIMPRPWEFSTENPAGYAA